MKLHERCELSNLFYKATFHSKLDFRQTRILNLATSTRLEIVLRKLTCKSFEYKSSMMGQVQVWTRSTPTILASP